ncbi:MAG: hypothetical protein ABIT01_02090, partial [Thermoanaerobaculia bacterium]
PAAGAPAPLPLLSLGPLVVGTVLTLVPNLPGVAAEDIPLTAERRVSIVSIDHRRLTLRWTGRVRLERPESARAREEWVRSRSNAGVHATPVPAVEPAYEEKEVTGTLSFPDFGRGRAFLLPGLWPEGTLSLKASSAIWLAPESWNELRRERRTKIPFFRAGSILKDPAAALLERASEMVDGEAPRHDQTARPKDFWRTLEGVGRVRLDLNGISGEVDTLRVANWFGVYDVLEQEGNLLVLSVLPDPPSSTLLDLFAPAKVLKTLLGYRVAAIETPPLKSAGKR